MLYNKVEKQKKGQVKFEYQWVLHISTGVFLDGKRSL